MTSQTVVGTEMISIPLAVGSLSVRKAEEGYKLLALSGRNTRELMEHDDLDTMLQLTNDLIWAPGQDALEDVLERMREASEATASFGM